MKYKKFTYVLKYTLISKDFPRMRIEKEMVIVRNNPIPLKFENLEIEETIT